VRYLPTTAHPRQCLSETHRGDPRPHGVASASFQDAARLTVTLPR
jgi:hypothetical protein